MIELLPHIYVLSNGLKLVYLHASSPVAHLGVTVLAGSRFEEDHEVGLAHFLEHSIFKGTEKRKAFHILSRLDSVGGELNAYTTKEEICVYASFVKTHLNRAAELLSDIAINSNFPEKEIQKEKEIVLDELNSYLDNPSDKIFDDYEALIFPNHPLGNNILGTPESVQSFGRDSLKSYVDKFFFTENTVLSFVGDIPLSSLVKQLEKQFKGMPSGKTRAIPRTFDSYIPVKKRVEEGNYQAHAIIGGIAPGYNSEHRRGMTMLTNVLGGPAMNSRLILSVREKYGYTYNIEAQYSPFPDLGYWSIYFGTDQKYLNKTIKIIYSELKKLREVPLTVKQLQQAKEQLKGHIALSLDSNVGLMQGLGKSLLLFNQIDTIQEIYASIDKLTSAELQEIAQTYFREENISELIYDVKQDS
ncbi:M16 family metallopeptidase [Fluviicola taffensis]|uniref:Processing peptidase n=1 Tax=Fluviicola taffensis (strain DSM 16823 / NCIMB 13979 / RW262) TaxID=755732 RepID=F2IHZ0_FLUTR|nr:pitrilysin family protein [Fluviicola taffensis]AEA45949.1 processing peptidase [Fluviicola taffensis DSM 16823]